MARRTSVPLHNKNEKERKRVFRILRFRLSLVIDLGNYFLSINPDGVKLQNDAYGD